MSETSVRALSATAHFSALFSSLWISILVPVVILLLSDDEVVRANAKESINFQLSIMLWSLICFVLAFALIGVFMFFALVVWSVVAPIFAGIHCLEDDGEPYRYRFSIHPF